MAMLFRDLLKEENLGKRFSFITGSNISKRMKMVVRYKRLITYLHEDEGEVVEGIILSKILKQDEVYDYEVLVID